LQFNALCESAGRNDSRRREEDFYMIRTAFGAVMAKDGAKVADKYIDLLRGKRRTPRKSTGSNAFDDAFGGAIIDRSKK